MSRRDSGPPNEVGPVKGPGHLTTAAMQVDTAKHNGHQPNGLRAALESLGGSLKSWTVMSDQSDPFRMDTPANHRDGAWLADTMNRLGITQQIHDRGIHYAILGQPKPFG